LSPVRVDVLCNFVVVNLDPDASPPSQVYPGLENEVRRYEPALDTLTHAYTVTYDLACNWKIAVENYLEAYHLLCVHPALRNSVRSERWKAALHPRHWTLIGVASEEGETAYDFTGAPQMHQTNWWLWPMLMLEQMPGGSQIFTYNHVPIGPERTLQVVDFYFPDPTPTARQRAEIEYIEKVVRIEDKETIEGVQRGLHSRGYRDGPLMIGPDMPEEWSERGVQHFQKLVLEALG
jgi:choline monooxygenase